MSEPPGFKPSALALSLAWTVAVWALAGPQLGHDQTAGPLARLLAWLWPGLDAVTVEAVHFVARKGAHVLNYAVGALLWRLALPTTRLRTVWLLVAAIACGDEARQALTPTRTGSAADVALDAVAAYATLRWLQRKDG